jgi:autotransporter strand-loop-strand O-heptosyltransferase
MKKIKLLFLTPHLSTGGMPQFVLKRIESLQKHKDQIEVFLVEYSMFSNTYVVQRDKIIKLLDDKHFFSLGWFHEPERKHELINIIKENEIDIVHIEEVTEGFESFNKIPTNLLNELYDNNRTWRIVETCHNIWFNAKNSKKFNPEYYSFVTPYHEVENFKDTPSYHKLIMYPYEDMVKPILNELGIYYDDHRVPLLKKLTEREKLGIDISKTHILNIGLWTEGKNQGEGVEVARLLENSHPDLHFHFVGNQAENFEKYWKPIMDKLPSNVTVWGERNDIDSFMSACDVMMFNSTWECNPLVLRESIGYGLKILTRNLPQYMGMYDNYITPIKSNDVTETSKQLVELIESDKLYKIEDQKDFGDEHLSLYNEVLNTPILYNEPIKSDIRVNQHFVVNPFIEIVGESDNQFEIKVYDNKTNELVYTNTLGVNHWVKLNKEYYVEWRTEISEGGKLIYNNVLDLSGRRVYISFGSKSLGDTMAWMPICDEFRKKHNCELIVSTFLNNLFVDQYPEIQFMEPGEVVHNIYAQYRLGWFYNEDGTYNTNSHKKDFKEIPLQQTASDILGLDHVEVRPKLKLPTPNKKKKVGLGVHSTAQSKYWNNPDGWQAVVDHLNALGYECMIYSKEGDGYMGNNYPEGVTVFQGQGLQSVINDMVNCEFFIGLSSGLSWLAWACELPVVLISGFSEKWAETTLDTYRVINENVCHGCFNWSRLDAGDWNWCPKYKGTEKQFECSKQISSEMVIREIDKIITNEKVEFKSKLDGFYFGEKEEEYIAHTKMEFDRDDMYDRIFTVDEGDVVVDLGASIGPFTYSILPRNPKHCYVVEPISSQLEILKQNVGKENVTIIQGAITDKKKIEIEWDGVIESVPTFSFKEFLVENNIDKIDFLKCDCEGGEYDVFQPSNIEFLKTIPKIVTEFHLRDNDEFHQCKFRWFRDNILPNFEKYEVYSVDGVNIKWDLWNDHFIEYYHETIIYIDNR